MLRALAQGKMLFAETIDNSCVFTFYILRPITAGIFTSDGKARLRSGTLEAIMRLLPVLSMVSLTRVCGFLFQVNRLNISLL